MTDSTPVWLGKAFAHATFAVIPMYTALVMVAVVDPAPVYWFLVGAVAVQAIDAADDIAHEVIW
ncbi:hypothetical protein C479_14178 [Halovivax asiaticus JCM 14624]|uniref:Uncharacterized protein n=1 Tax=Halovivax asiaticus JCM 14624 TaxID=1227490 RepID=M0BDY2_9EURY|nr:hypothetical protein [Halovivax asiaticus]ELZ08493.1 hypothetical protein C479_14178 [Halovivax asiaticus JCM 14624]